jgi:hypothetical protein
MAEPAPIAEPEAPRLVAEPAPAQPTPELSISPDLDPAQLVAAKAGLETAKAEIAAARAKIAASKKRSAKHVPAKPQAAAPAPNDAEAVA